MLKKYLFNNTTFFSFFSGFFVDTVMHVSWTNVLFFLDFSITRVACFFCWQHWKVLLKFCFLKRRLKKKHKLMVVPKKRTEVSLGTQLSSKKLPRSLSFFWERGRFYSFKLFFSFTSSQTRNRSEAEGGVQYFVSFFCPINVNLCLFWDGDEWVQSKHLNELHWRASLVPVAAAYTNVVAVKKLVVGFQY